MVHACAAIAFECRAKKAKGAHLRKYLAIEAFLPVRQQYARHELVLAIGARRIPHHAFLIIELLFEQ
jgi:hypothetical protein